ncbi:unnamed protein product, partial [Musa acuminata subsp. burmannicoides]
LFSVLQASSRSLQEMLSNIVFPVPNNGSCMNFVTSDMLNMMDENKEVAIRKFLCIKRTGINFLLLRKRMLWQEWMSNSSSRVIPTLENCHLGMLQISNHQMFNLASEVRNCREAEAYLPPLSEREGILLDMDDMTLAVTWKFKFRFWPNNKSRMYILENTAGFVRAHCLQAGDFIFIYRNPTSGNHIVRGNKGMPQRSPLDSLQYSSRNQFIVNEDCCSSTLHVKKARSDRRHSPINPNKIIGHGSSSLTMTELNDLEGDITCHPHYFPE